jgi:hypothetical protein
MDCSPSETATEQLVKSVKLDSGHIRELMLCGLLMIVMAESPEYSGATRCIAQSPML